MEKRIVFRVHSVKRMFKRSISVDDVRQLLESGEVIEEYPDDFPCPSRLVLGWVNGRPLHVVFAENISAGETIVVTVYEPNPDCWDKSFKERVR